MMALAISAIFSFAMRETLRERVRFALTMALSLVGLVVVLAWVMLPFPR